MQHEIKSVRIANLIDWHKGQYLRANPEYQRGAVWGSKNQKLLIDSILRGYPLPIFYLHYIEEVSGDLMRKAYEIIDGQQRIAAIAAFERNEFKLFDMTTEKVTGLPRFLKKQPCEWSGKTFETLSKDLQLYFLNCEVQVATIRSDDSNEIRELFVRLQQGLPLNAQEKRDAWPGAFTEFVNRTAGRPPKYTGHEFFERILKAANKNRGGERQACAQIYMTFQARKEKGHPDSFVDLNSTQIDEFYRHHLDICSDDPLLHRFREILDVATDLLGDKKRKPIQLHVAIHTILLIDTLLDDFAAGWKNRFPMALDRFLLNLAEATEAARKGETENNPYWTQYGLYARTNSDTKRVILNRHRFFVKEMLDLMQPLGRKDPKRAFSQAERELLYLRSNKTCQICSELVDWTDVEAHHVEPHSDGGVTSLENALLVHRECHPRGKHSYGPDRLRLPCEAKVPESSEPIWAIDTDDDIPGSIDGANAKRARRGIPVTIVKGDYRKSFSTLNAAREEVYRQVHGTSPKYPENAARCREFLKSCGFHVYDE